MKRNTENTKRLADVDVVYELKDENKMCTA